MRIDKVFRFWHILEPIYPKVSWFMCELFYVVGLEHWLVYIYV